MRILPVIINNNNNSSKPPFFQGKIVCQKGARKLIIKELSEYYAECSEEKRIWKFGKGKFSPIQIYRNFRKSFEKTTNTEGLKDLTFVLTPSRVKYPHRPYAEIDPTLCLDKIKYPDGKIFTQPKGEDGSTMFLAIDPIRLISLHKGDPPFSWMTSEILTAARCILPI